MRRRAVLPAVARGVAALGLAALFAVAAPAAALRDVPFLSGRVVDEAGMFTPEARAALEAKLAALEETTKTQIAVLTVTSLEGEDLEGFSLRVAETWKLGDDQRDDGVLFLIARDDRKMRIEVGYGLEPTLTDIRTRRIQDDIVRPAFRAGDYVGGINLGVDALGAVLQGQEPAVPATKPPEVTWGVRAILSVMLLLIVLVFGGVGVHTPGCGSAVVFAIVTPFVAVLGATIASGQTKWILLAWLVLYCVARIVMRVSGRVPKASAGSLRGAKGQRWWNFDSGSSSSGSSWSSSSSSSDSYSGGGGDFGGGGSSSSW